MSFNSRFDHAGLPVRHARTMMSEAQFASLRETVRRIRTDAIDRTAIALDKELQQAVFSGKFGLRLPLSDELLRP